jgi:hypothetical protein
VRHDIIHEQRRAKPSIRSAGARIHKRFIKLLLFSRLRKGGFRFMRKLSFVLALALFPALTGPAAAQTREQQQRWEDAQERYRVETEIYQRERDRYMAARDRDREYGPFEDGRDRYATDYDAARDYRDDRRYEERRLTAQDEVYRGSDGRYYCKRSDGTTGLVIGGATGGLIGNVIDGGRHRTAGTLIGGALGAIMGRAIEQSNDVRCR